MKSMTVGSLFAGIGGFDLGFERAGFEIRWQVEIDPFCRAVLAKHWPGVKRYEDVRYCTTKQRAELEMDSMAAGGCGDAPSCPITYHGLEPVDVICGGFPCQDISPAGRRAGIRGKQSGLWSEFHRLIRQLRPRYVVVENSSNLLADGYGMDVVVGELAAIGYDAEWDCLPAAAFGAPHERERVFIVAYPAGRSEGRSHRPRLERVERTDVNHHEPKDGRAPQGPTLAQERAGAIPDADGEGCHWPDVSVQRRGEDNSNVDAGGSRADVADPDQAGQPLIFGRAASAELARFRTAHSGPWWRIEPEMVRVVHGVSANVVRRREQHPAQVGGLGNSVVPQIAQWIAERIKEAEAGEGAVTDAGIR